MKAQDNFAESPGGSCEKDTPLYLHRNGGAYRTMVTGQSGIPPVNVGRHAENNDIEIIPMETKQR
jgi:hypothetical protein